MAYTALYKQVLKTYDQDRMAAHKRLEKRKAHVYEEIPRLSQLDEQLQKDALAISRLILSGGAKGEEEVVAALKASMAKAKAEKEGLLVKAGIPSGYLSEVYTCNRCQDTGYIGQEKCPCFTQRLVEKFYGMSNVKDMVAKENFDTFDIRCYSKTVASETGLSPYENMQAVYTACMEFTSQFGSNAGKDFQNLLLYGDTGLGKTFLCNCIAKEILDKGHTVLYVTAPQMFKKLEALRFNRLEDDQSALSADEQSAMIYDVDLLIIDDLGSEFSTVLTHTALFDIVNSRLLSQRPTVISTNLQVKDLQSHYSDRLASRFYGFYTMLYFFGADIRLLKRLGMNPS